MTRDGHYEFTELGYGVLLYDPDSGEEVFLQGDGAEDFLCSVHQLDEIWERNGWESPNPRCFPTYEHHLDVLIDPYF